MVTSSNTVPGEAFKVELKRDGDEGPCAVATQGMEEAVVGINEALAELREEHADWDHDN